MAESPLLGDVTEDMQMRIAEFWLMHDDDMETQLSAWMSSGIPLLDGTTLGASEVLTMMALVLVGGDTLKRGEVVSVELDTLIETQEYLRTLASPSGLHSLATETDSGKDYFLTCVNALTAIHLFGTYSPVPIADDMMRVRDK